MQKTKFLSILAIGLLLSNLILLVYIFQGRAGSPPPDHRPDRPRNIIIERLHFTNAQIEEYDHLIQQHRSAIEDADRRIMQLKNRLYSQLSTSVGDMEKDSLLNAIAETQRSIESIHYHHFEDIKKLCTPEQAKDFDMLATDLASLFSHPHPKHPPR